MQPIWLGNQVYLAREVAQRLWPMILFVLHAVGLATAPPWFEKHMLPTKQARDAVRTITDAPTYVVVDANNARGAVNFRFSHLNFADLVSLWARRSGLAQRVVVCWDHGSVRQAREHDNVCHAFAGPRESADDLIAETVLPRLYENGERVYVVTTDRGLLQRCKVAASEHAAHGKLRFLGTRKFASLLLHAANDEKVANAASEETVAADSSSSAIAHGYERCDKSVRAFAATQRKKRWHESKRRRVRAPDGFVAPFAERTWHRVVLAEKMRRLLVTHTSSDEDASLIELPPSSSPLPGAETLLDDCRLDGKQRQLILKFGGALSNGLCRPPAPKPVNEEAEERSGYRFPATRRQRRKNRRDAAKRIAPAAANARTHAELSSVEREAQLDGLEKWLAEGDESLWEAVEEESV